MSSPRNPEQSRSKCGSVGKSQPYEVFTEADSSARAYIELLDVEFYWDGQEFDVLNPMTGKTIDRWETEHEARMAEREARLAAEARERELLEEIESLRRRISE